MIITLTNIGDETLRLLPANRGNFIAVSDWSKTALLPSESSQLIATIPSTGYIDSYLDFMQSLSSINSRISVQFSYSEKVISGLIQSLPLNELSGNIAYDISPEDNRGVYSSGVLLGNADSPIPGDKMPRFDGNDVINLYSAGLSADFNPMLGSVCFFMQVASASVWSDGANKYLIFLQADNNNQMFIFKSSTVNTLIFRRRSGGTLITKSVTMTPSVNAIHIGMTWSVDSNRLRVYIDGMLSGKLEIAGTWSGSLAIALLGANNISGSLGWNGYMSQYRLYDRELSAQEVFILANT